MTNVKTTEETTRMIPSFMAVSNELPIIGRRYQCKKIKADPETGVYWQKMHTSPVVSVTELAKNVMAVRTFNSWYITRILGVPTENVHFAIVKCEPKVGKHLKCFKLEGPEERIVSLETSTVMATKYIGGLFKVKTRNSIYVCFPA